MTVHIATPELLLLELESGESCENEQIKNDIRKALKSRGLEEWNSVEIELFCSGERNLAFAVPVKLYIPEIFAKILEMHS
ncbi:MAG: hypothetical protein GX025_05200 [Clostridiales bacterium]|nr:hypothetical protein [Clostridiales bacterium]